MHMSYNGVIAVLLISFMTGCSGEKKSAETRTAAEVKRETEQASLNASRDAIPEHWPDPFEPDKPQTTIEEKIVLTHQFRDRIFRSYQQLRGLAPVILKLLEERLMRTRPDPGIPPIPLYVTNEQWTVLAKWWDLEGHVYVVPMSSGRVNELESEFRHKEKIRNECLFAISRGTDIDAQKDKLKLTEARMAEICVLLGHDVLRIPYDEATHQFRFTDTKDSKSPEVVLKKLLEMYYAMTETDWLNMPFVPVRP